MDEQCKFCKSYSQVKEIDEYWEMKRPTPHLERRYFARLVSKFWNSKCEQYQSCAEYDTVELKYCPLCGKKL